MTRHNGRAGKNGTYNPKHNDRSFDLKNSDHIDEERAGKNIYRDCFNGFRTQNLTQYENDVADTLEEAEKTYYEIKYKDFIKGQHERNRKNRHPERNRSALDLLQSKKTCPEETVYQIGTMEDHIAGEKLFEIVTEFIGEMNTRFGSHVKTLDWALHMDESTPHIHERHVFECENKYGELCSQQEKALEALGFELPEPDQPPGRTNNRKMTFDSACRVHLFDICKKHGLELEEVPEYGGRAYLEKQDFILKKQKEKIVYQEEKLTELTVKIEDVEKPVDEVTDAAYDKAVEVISDTVRLEVHNEDIKIAEGYKSWLQSPERKAPKNFRDFAVLQLDRLIKKFKKAMDSILEKIQRRLMSLEVKKAAKEQIKEKAQPSVLGMIERFKADIKREDEEKAKRKEELNKKQNRER